MAEVIVEKNSFIIPSEDSSKEVSFTNTTLKIDVNDNKDHRVATTYSHPQAKYVKGKIDDEYVFDKNTTQNNPIYCDTETYNGCIGDCVSCTTCVSDCNAHCFDKCVDCNTCQTCDSCQSVCQTSGYGPYVVSSTGKYYYKCNTFCMNCNNSVYGCNSCYTGTHIRGEK